MFPIALPPYMQLDCGPTIDCVSGGDSGGPIYRSIAGSSAYAAGIVSGEAGPGGAGDDVIYMAANYFRGLGISILTQWNTASD